MAAAVESSTENLQGVNEALQKAKKHLLLTVQIFDDQIDEQRELSELIMNEVCDGRAEVEKVNYDLNYLTKTLREWEKLQYFRIKELRDVRTELGLSKQGKKETVISSFYRECSRS